MNKIRDLNLPIIINILFMMIVRKIIRDNLPYITECYFLTGLQKDQLA